MHCVDVTGSMSQLKRIPAPYPNTQHLLSGELERQRESTSFSHHNRIRCCIFEIVPSNRSSARTSDVELYVLYKGHQGERECYTQVCDVSLVTMMFGSRPFNIWCSTGNTGQDCAGRCGPSLTRHCTAVWSAGIAPCIPRIFDVVG